MAQSTNRPIQHRAPSMQVSRKGLQQVARLTRHRRSLLTGAAILPAMALCLLMADTAARAETIEWKGAAGGSWFDAANWQISPDGANVVPKLADTAVIYTAGPTISTPGAAAATIIFGGSNSSFAITAGGTLRTNGAALGSGANNVATATVSGAGALWTSYGSITLGPNDGTGTLTVSNGGKVITTVTTLKSGSSSITVTGAGSEYTTGYTYIEAGKIIVSEGGQLLLYTDPFNLENSSNLFIGAGSTNAADAVAPGYVKQSEGVISLRSGGTINFNHTDQTRKYEFSPVLTGAGTLEFINGATVLTANSSAFTGATNVREKGTLVVKGSLAGSDVNVWGVLAGNGAVKSATIKGNGKIEPGNSIGTLHINGDLTMEAESDYTVEINGSASDLIDVGGSATILSSTFEIQRYDTALSPVLPGTTYTILTTAGGLTVQSPTVAVADFPFLNFTLSEDGFNGYLTTSRSSERFAELASTPNEIAVANVLDGLGSGTAWEQVVGASDAQARAAFTSLGGASFHASALSVLSNQSHFLRDAVINRLADANAGGLQTIDGLSATNDPATAIASAPAYAMWGQVLGSWGAFDGNSNAARVTDSIGGLITGVDVSVAETWRFGIAGGYSHSTFQAEDIAASGSNDSYHVALYGGWQSEGWALRGGAAYSWNDIDTSRQVQVVGIGGVQDGGYDLGTTQLFAEGAYKFAYGTSTFEPFANLAYVLVDGDVNESGLFATSGPAQMDTTYTTLGLRTSTVLMERLTARGTLGWRHAFGDVTPEVALAFNTGGPAFGLSGAPIAVDAAVAELGLDYDLGADATLSVTYSGQYGSDSYENSAQAGFTWRF
jgi:outer membrane autotransporter protein